MTEPCPALGFFVSVELSSRTSTRVLDEFRASWLDFLAQRGLYAMSADSEGRRWAIGSEGSQASDVDCEAARAWLAARPEVERAEVGPIEDLNEAS